MWRWLAGILYCICKKFQNCRKIPGIGKILVTIYAICKLTWKPWRIYSSWIFWISRISKYVFCINFKHGLYLKQPFTFSLPRVQRWAASPTLVLSPVFSTHSFCMHSFLLHATDFFLKEIWTIPERRWRGEKRLFHLPQAYSF